MVQGIFSNVTAQKLLQRGFKASTEGLRKGVTVYSKVLPKGTKVEYSIENGKCIFKEVRTGSGTYAKKVNNIGHTLFDGKEMLAYFSREHHFGASVLGNTSKVKNAIQYNTQLRKEGYDIAARIDAIKRAFS